MLNSSTLSNLKNTIFNRIKVKRSFSQENLDVVQPLAEGIFLFSDGSIGSVCRIEGFYDETETREHVRSYLASLQASLSELSSDFEGIDPNSRVVVQIINEQDVASYEESSFQFSGQGSSILNEEQRMIYDAYLPTKRNVYLSVRVQFSLEQKDKTLLASFLDKMKFEEESIEEKLFVFKRSIQSFFSQFSDNENILSENKLKKLYQKLLCQSEDHPVHKFNGDIRVEVSSGIENTSENLIHYRGKKYGAAFFLEKGGNDVQFGRMAEFLNAIPYRKWVCAWTISDIKSAVSSDYMLSKSFFKNPVVVTEEYAAYTDFERDVSMDNPYCTQSFKLVVFGENQYEERDSVQIKSLSREYLNCRMLAEVELPTHTLSACLPMNCSAENNKIQYRCKTIHMSNAVAFAPVFCGPKRQEESRLMISQYNSPTGYISSFGEGNRMAIGLGQTRSGKSAFSIQEDMDFLTRYDNSILRVIDISTSREKVIDALGGQLVDFSGIVTGEFNYSPFDLDAPDSDDISSLCYLIKLVLVNENKGIEFSASHTKLIEKSLKMAYNLSFRTMESFEFKGKYKHPTWKTIRDELPNAKSELELSSSTSFDIEAEEIRKWSVCLSGNDGYGKLFNGQVQSHEMKKSRYRVYDMGKNSNNEMGQVVALMTVIRVLRDIKKEDISAKKRIIFEEFGSLVRGNSASAEILKEFFQLFITTLAKYNTGVLLVTNAVEDLSTNSAGRMMWEKASLKVFLPCKELLSSMKKSWGDEFNEAEWQIIESLEKDTQNKRVGIYVSSTNEDFVYKSSIYVPLSPQMDALTSSSPSQTKYYRKQKSKGMKGDEIIDLMAKRFPYGAGL